MLTVRLAHSRRHLIKAVENQRIVQRHDGPRQRACHQPEGSLRALHLI